MCVLGVRMCVLGVQPEEGELLSVQPGAEGEPWVLSERGDDGGEDQCYQHKAGWEDHLVQRPKHWQLHPSTGTAVHAS